MNKLLLNEDMHVNQVNGVLLIHWLAKHAYTGSLQGINRPLKAPLASPPSSTQSISSQQHKH